MEKLRATLMRFMYGRYGLDLLNRHLFGLILGMMVFNLFLPSTLLTGLLLTLLVWAYFRMFSKNIYKRQQENALYQQRIAPVNKGLKLLFKRLRDSRTHRYRKCQGCGQVLRLKRQVGHHKTTCPKCGHVTSVHIPF